MHAFFQEATANGDPFQVGPVGNVVNDPHDKDHDKREHKGPGDIVVHPFGGKRDGCVRILADQRDNCHPAEQRDQARDREQYETAGKKPVSEPLNGLEPRNRPARLFSVDPDTARAVDRTAGENTSVPISR